MEEIFIKARQQGRTMKNKIIETVQKMSDVEISQLYEHLFGAGADKEEKIDADVKYLNERFTAKEMQKVAGECIGTGIGIDMVADFVRYRNNEIKKPVKTTRPIIALVRKLVDASSQGYDMKQILEIMKDNEWQSFEIDWIQKKLPKRQVGAGLGEFGFNQDNTRLLK